MDSKPNMSLTTKLVCQLFNWFMFYCLVRTFSNSLETVFTMVALYYWSLTRPFGTSRRMALAMAAFTCLIRPTSAVIWLWLGIVHLLELSTWTERFRLIFLEVLPIGVGTVLLSVGVDYQFYGKVT